MKFSKFFSKLLPWFLKKQKPPTKVSNNLPSSLECQILNPHERVRTKQGSLHEITSSPKKNTQKPKNSPPVKKELTKTKSNPSTHHPRHKPKKPELVTTPSGATRSKAKCPKCTKKFGDLPLYQVAGSDVEKPVESSEPEPAMA